MTDDLRRLGPDDLRYFVSGARSRNARGEHSEGDLVTLTLWDRIAALERENKMLWGHIHPATQRLIEREREARKEESHDCANIS